MAKMDELHNYAYPDKYLDELHIYDKSIGNTGNNDEIHNYGNRGVTYGVDEMHLYGSYQTVVDTSEDEVNTPKQYELIDIDEYFDEIEDMDEQQKEDRKDLAKDFLDILMLILMLMLADMTAGNPINAEFYYALTKSRMMDAVDKHVTVTATLYSKIENYLHFENELAKKIAKEMPHIKIDVLIYVDLWECPDNIQLCDNIVIDQATWNADGLRKIGAKDGSSLIGTGYMKNLLSYRKVCKNTVFYDF